MSSIFQNYALLMSKKKYSSYMKFFGIVNGFYKHFFMINAQKRYFFDMKKHLLILIFILSWNILKVFIAFILIFDLLQNKLKLFETYHLCNTVIMIAGVTTVDPLYSERVGPAKSVHLRRVFTINVFNLTIN